jgi:hypothetical protein
LSTKSITVFSNDTDTPSLVLTLKGEVTVDVEVIPTSALFEDIPMGQTSNMNIALNISEPDKVHIKSVICEDSRFSVKLISGTDPGKVTLEITFLGSKKQERISATAKVLLDGTEKKDIDIPIHIQVVGNLKYPKQISIMKNGDVFNTRDIDIVNRLGKSFKMKRVQDKDNRLKLDYPKTPGKEIRLTASVRDPKISLDTSARGTIQIQTTDPLDSTIEIAYTISKRRTPADYRKQQLKDKQNKQTPPLKN